MISWKRAIKAAIITGTAFATLTAFASATELKTGIGYVNADSGLRLREAASTDSEIISTAIPGDTVVVIRQVGDWYLVDYNLDIGYMSAEYLKFMSVESVDLGTGKTNCALVNVRSAPSTNGDLVQQLAEGYEVTIIGINEGWYKVTFDGKTGYIRSDLLELTSAPGGNASGEGTTPTSTLGEQICSYAQNYLGVPYVWGGTTTSGFDCSGFTQYIMKQFGITLKRTAAQQMKNNGYAVNYSDLQPGDLVFFGNTYSSSESATHVGIYIGDSNFIHAASGGVKITSLSSDYYAARYVGARRVIS